MELPHGPSIKVSTAEEWAYPSPEVMQYAAPVLKAKEETIAG